MRTRRSPCAALAPGCCGPAHLCQHTARIW